MKVLLIQPVFYVYGGAELVLVRLCNYLSEHGVETTLLTGGILSEIRRDLKNTKIIVPIETNDAFRDISNYIRKNKSSYSLINLHNHPAELFLEEKTTSVWNCNEPATEQLKGDIPPQDWIDKIAMINKIIVSDPLNKNRIFKFYKRRDAIINNYGIDIDFWSIRSDRETLLKKYNLKGSFIILHSGWFNEFKNQLDTVKTINEIRKSIPNVKGIFTGFNNTSTAMECLKYIQENNLTENIQFTGHVSRNVLREIVSCSDIAVFPYLEQGGWLSPFEFTCAGLPIVFYPSVLAASTLKEHNIGEETKDLQKSILDFHKEPDILKERAIKGTEWIKQNMTWDKFCERELEIFKEIV